MCRNPLGKACCFAAPPPMGSAIAKSCAATGPNGGCFLRLATLLLDECGISKLHRLQLDCLGGEPAGATPHMGDMMSHRQSSCERLLASCAQFISAPAFQGFLLQQSFRLEVQ